MQVLWSFDTEPCLLVSNILRWKVDIYYSKIYRMFIFGGRDIEKGSYGDIIVVSINGDDGKFTYKWEIPQATCSPRNLTLILL